MTASLRTLEAVISSLGLNSLMRVREAAPIFSVKVALAHE